MRSKQESVLTAQGKDQVFYSQVMFAVTLCGISFALAFAIYHFLWGNSAVSLILTPVIVVQAVALILLIRNGFNAFSAWSIAIIQTATNVLFVHEVGLVASYWLYASGVANYYIVNRRIALSLNTIACLATVFIAFDAPDFAVRYCAAFAMINVFLYTFAVQLERKNHELDRMLTIDPLTLAGNRTAMDEAILRVRNLYDRYQTPVTLIMIDLDHFKQINDTMGHSAGDKVLRRVADKVQGRLRPTDKLFRFGGEEFVIVAENTTLAQASHLAEDIRQRIARDEGERHQAEISLTVSMGVAQLREAESGDNWIDRADKALYKAKSMGRNWVCFDGELESVHQPKPTANQTSALPGASGI